MGMNSSTQELVEPTQKTAISNTGMTKNKPYQDYDR